MIQSVLIIKLSQRFNYIYFSKGVKRITRFKFSRMINDSISFNNREIFLNAFNNHASKIVIAHNHPSQNVSPSLADKKATIEIKKASLLIGIELVDHIIVSYNDYFSFKENGLI